MHNKFKMLRLFQKMKQPVFMKYLLIQLLFLSLDCFSQKITIKLLDRIDVIPYVSIADSTKGLIGYSDSNGEIELEAGFYNLKLSHVSYPFKMIKIVKPTKDSIITVLLSKKNSILTTVVVKNVKYKNRKFIKVGNLNKKNNSSLAFKDILKKQKLLFGILFYPMEDTLPLLLRSIRFKISEMQNIKDIEFLLELKIFPMNNNIVSTTPLNELPIYITSSALRKNNEIFIKEKINYPEDGFMLTLLIPQIKNSGNENFSLIFPGGFYGEKPQFYSQNNFNDTWTANTLSQKGLPPNDGKYFHVDFDLTCWK